MEHHTELPAKICTLFLQTGMLHVIIETSNKTYARTVDPVKSLDTGLLYNCWRTSDKFIVKETVMFGFNHDFLDSVEVFTIEGFHVGKKYRIRETKWDSYNNASKYLVSQMISTYLRTAKNIDEMFCLAINQLYYDNDCNMTILENFLQNE